MLDHSGNSQGLPKRLRRAISKRHQNHRLVKVHRNYTVAEIADLFSIHKNTIRRWIKEGLPALKDQRPWLIRGDELSHFLQEKRKRHKRPCKPGQLYCVRCHSPKIPAENMVDIELVTEKAGNLFGICPDCGEGMNRFFSLEKMEQIREEMGVANAVITTNKCKSIQRP